MKPQRRSLLPEVLFEIGKAIGSDEDLSSLLSHISELICKLLDACACSVMLLDASGRQLFTKAAHGLAEGRIGKLSFGVGQGVAGWVVQEGKPALIHDVSTDPRFILVASSSTNIVSMASVPLIARNHRVGVLSATSDRIAAFSEEEIELLQFVAKTIALDVENMRLRKVAVTDPLTSAYNREFLQQRLPVEMEIAKQLTQPLSVAMIDVDHFKTINDRFGHEVGDRVLAEVAKRLRWAIRQDDLLVRYGGEEFIVLLPNTDMENAAQIGERMRNELNPKIPADNTQIDVRISVGIAQQKKGDEVSTLIKRADDALYAAKDRGRDRIVVAGA